MVNETGDVGSACKGVATLSGKKKTSQPGIQRNSRTAMKYCDVRILTLQLSLTFHRRDGRRATVMYPLWGDVGAKDGSPSKNLCQLSTAFATRISLMCNLGRCPLRSSDCTLSSVSSSGSRLKGTR